MARSLPKVCPFLVTVDLKLKWHMIGTENDRFFFGKLHKQQLFTDVIVQWCRHCSCIPSS